MNGGGGGWIRTGNWFYFTVTIRRYNSVCGPTARRHSSQFTWALLQLLLER
jgi:hypothetical protein